MGDAVDVLVIGAGPYGLSLAAHLRERDVEFRIVGETMAGWKKHMPPGMLLKSQPWASSLASPAPSYPLRRYYADNRVAYDDAFHFVPLDTFVSYGESYQRRFNLRVDPKRVISLAPTQDRGFSLRFDDGEVTQARRVVVAVGLPPFKWLPPMVDQFPAELVSHSSEYGPYDHLKGKRVVVVGGGSSAIDLAVLLSEAGIEATMVARRPKLDWGEPPSTRLLRDRIRYPDAGIGTSWPFMVAAYAPWMVHCLPDKLRVRFAYTGGLGPLGGFPMQNRFERVKALFGHKIDRMKIKNDAIDLHVTDTDNQSAILTADHAIFATGYQINMQCLDFLDPAMMSKMDRIGAAPRLSWNYESSIPGLYFIGPAAAPSFGPICRFVHGTTHPSRHLSRHLTRDRDSQVQENVGRDREVSVA